VRGRRRESLEDVATRLRIESIRATTAAGSGHPSSSASAADLVAAVFFEGMRLDPEAPRALHTDRFVLSKGHAAPLLYAAWAEVGVVARDELARLRTLESDLEGHPTPRLPFVDVATGSLGQGLSAGLGLALGARMAGYESSTWVLLGDGECAEGSVWEAVGLAAQLRLDTLIAVIDVNGLGQSGPTMIGNDVQPYCRRFRAFDWRAIAVDGHDMGAVMAAVRRARQRTGSPTAIVAATVKGKGIEGIEGAPGWHGRPLPPDAAARAIERLEGQQHGAPPPRLRAPARAPETSAASHAADLGYVSPPPAWTGPAAAEVATREAYGDALVRLGASEPSVVALDGDVKNSTYAERFQAAYPDRFIDAFIAEQNMVGMAMGLAAQGWIPFASTFACFLTRAADQIRMAGVSGSNVKLCGSHAGVSIGEDGPSQMGLEDLALFRAVPGALVLYPSDAVSTDACVRLAAAHRGVAYIRTTRPRTPVLYNADEPFPPGGLKVLRSGEHDLLAVVAAGITLHEALAAHQTLRAEGLEIAVVDLYCVSPIDGDGLRAVAERAGRRLLTVEDHYAAGGLGEAVLAAVGPDGVPVHVLAVRDVPRSGPPRQLLEHHGIGREAIARRVRELCGRPVVAAA
jgi:transketolase